MAGTVEKDLNDIQRLKGHRTILNELQSTDIQLKISIKGGVEEGVVPFEGKEARNLLRQKS